MNKNVNESGFYVSARICRGHALLLGPYPTYGQAKAMVSEAMRLAQADPQVWGRLLEAMEACGGLVFGVVEVDGWCAHSGRLRTEYSLTERADHENGTALAAANGQGG